jgi:hypothetical protein
MHCKVKAKKRVIKPLEGNDTFFAQYFDLYQNMADVALM